MAAPKAELSRLQRMMGQASPETTSGYVHYDVDEHRRIDPPAWRSACALSGRACGLSLTRRVVGKRVADSVGCLVGGRVERRRSPRSWSSPPRPSAAPRLQPSRHLPLIDFTATRITGQTSAVALERCSLRLGRDPKLTPQTLSARPERSTEPVPHPSGRFGWRPDNQLPGSIDCHELERSKPDRKPALTNRLDQQSANPLPNAPVIRGR